MTKAIIKNTIKPSEKSQTKPLTEAKFQPKPKLMALAMAGMMSIGSVSNTYAIEQGSTETGLDKLVEIIKTDEGLARKISAEEIDQGAEAADQMNQIIVQSIYETGVANDGVISRGDARELNDHIYENFHEVWVELHGDDENGEETGFHLVQNDGAKTRLFRRNAVNKVADGIYHLGFESNRKNRLLNEDGNRNAKYKHVGQWLNSLLLEDLAAGTLKNPDIEEVVGTTGTGLDQIIDVIYDDERLMRKVAIGDIREAATSADGMNHILVEAIELTGVGAEGEFSADDIRTINAYIQANHKERWAELHGDDEKGEETGYHLVQRDGAKTKLFGKNAINKVFDSIYHLGFEANKKGNRILNEDGNKNASFKKIAQWLTGIYFGEIN